MYWISNVFTIFTTFILLVITTTNSYIIDNTILKVIDRIERLIGYRFNGRRIGKPTKYKQSKKIPLLMKILKKMKFLMMLLIK